MLKKPRYFDVIYRLWNYGSTNLFLWGDADYARRFSKSCSLSGSAGFQINTPLSLKYGHELDQKEAWDTFRKPELRCGKWEEERFWMWYTVFGRLGYNTSADPGIWKDEFTARFGEKAGEKLEQALAFASKIVPFITTVHMPVHPSLRYWIELNTGWALFSDNNLDKPKSYDFVTGISYGSAEPSDHGLFYGIDEYAADLTAGTLQGKYSPLQSAQLLDDLAEQTLSLLKDAEDAGVESGAEYLAMRVDLAMLCDLARYHAEKMRAALALALWRAGKGEGYLSDTSVLLDSAMNFWKSLSDRGLENYHHDLNFSSAGSETRRGTWADLTCELEADRKTLDGLLQENHIAVKPELTGCYSPLKIALEPGHLAADFPETICAGQPLRIELRMSSLGLAEAAPILHYRHTDQTEGLFHALAMERSALGYAAVIPGEYITKDWDLQVYITVQGPSGTCVMLPGVYHPSYPYPYHVISVQ
jgi:hypothetical protein